MIAGISDWVNVLTDLTTDLKALLISPRRVVQCLAICLIAGAHRKTHV